MKEQDGNKCSYGCVECVKYTVCIYHVCRFGLWHQFDHRINVEVYGAAFRKCIVFVRMWHPPCWITTDQFKFYVIRL